MALSNDGNAEVSCQPQDRVFFIQATFHVGKLSQEDDQRNCGCLADTLTGGIIMCIIKLGVNVGWVVSRLKGFRR